jgi:hypothetical protein
MLKESKVTDICITVRTIHTRWHRLHCEYKPKHHDNNETLVNTDISIKSPGTRRLDVQGRSLFSNVTQNAARQVFHLRVPAYMVLFYKT